MTDNPYLSAIKDIDQRKNNSTSEEELRTWTQFESDMLKKANEFDLQVKKLQSDEAKDRSSKDDLDRWIEREEQKIKDEKEKQQKRSEEELRSLGPVSRAVKNFNQDPNYYMTGGKYIRKNPGVVSKSAEQNPMRNEPGNKRFKDTRRPGDLSGTTSKLYEKTKPVSKSAVGGYVTNAVRQMTEKKDLD